MPRLANVSTMLIILLVLQGCQALSLQEFTMKQGAKYTQPAASNVLDEAAIRAQIVGNTMVGISPKNNQEYVEYYLPDGTIRVLWMGSRYSAKWAVSGYLWCVEYEGSPRSCYMFSLDGDTVTWYGPEKGERQEKAKLLPGNARGL